MTLPKASALRAALVAEFIPKDYEFFDAVASQSISAIVKLYSAEINPVQPDILDHDGNTVLHIACKGGNILVVRTILVLFEHRYGLSKKRNGDGFLPIELTDKLDIKKSLEMFERPILHQRAPSLKTELNKAINYQLIRDVLQGQDEKLTVMLSLDGGGIRGIVLIQLLMNLERRLGKNIHRYFDWIAGTSTGAVIAVSLGLNKTLEECLRIYLRLKKEIFSSGRRPYNCARYETYLKFVFGHRTRMNEMKDHKIIVTTCQSNIAPPKLKLFRNFQPTLETRDLREYEYDDPETCYIWKACRCSSAAPTYFLPFEGIYSDGGLMANNPTEVLMTEYFRYKHLQEYVGEASPPSLGCVISLGTGMAQPVTISSKGRTNDILRFISKTTEQIKNMALVFIKQITASDGLPVEKARTWAHSVGVPFFRFSPPLTQKIDLDENRDTFIIQMMWDTEVYMATECADELDQLAKFLLTLHSNSYSTSTLTSSSNSNSNDFII